VKNQKIDYNLLIAGGLLIGVFILFKKVGSAGSGLLNIFGKNTEEENQQLSELKEANYWNFQAFLNDAPAGALLLTMSYSLDLVNQLWDATGYFNDDEQAIYGVFRSLKTRSQVAFLAKRFFELKQQDLYSYLENYLNDSELLNVKGIIDSKPMYNI
jgi:hypothetical protein